MTSPGPAFQECTAPKAVSSDLRSTDGLTVLARIEIRTCHLGTLSTILQHFTHTMKPSDPLLLADVTLRCRMAKLTSLDT